MSSNLWISKAEDLHARLTSFRMEQANKSLTSNPDQAAEWEQGLIARWLREEFSEEPPEDTSTLPLF